MRKIIFVGLICLTSIVIEIAHAYGETLPNSIQERVLKDMGFYEPVEISLLNDISTWDDNSWVQSFFVPNGYIKKWVVEDAHMVETMGGGYPAPAKYGYGHTEKLQPYLRIEKSWPSDWLKITIAKRVLKSIDYVNRWKLNGLDTWSFTFSYFLEPILPKLPQLGPFKGKGTATLNPATGEWQTQTFFMVGPDYGSLLGDNGSNSYDEWLNRQSTAVFNISGEWKGGYNFGEEEIVEFDLKIQQSGETISGEMTKVSHTNLWNGYEKASKDTSWSGTIQGKVSGATVRFTWENISDGRNSQDFYGDINEKSTEIFCKATGYPGYPMTMGRVGVSSTASPESSRPPGQIPKTLEKVLKGTYAWDIDSDTDGNVNSADIWWEHVDDHERYLVPMNGSKLAVIKDAKFDKLNLQDLQELSYNDVRISASDKEPVIDVGTVFAVQTIKGNFVKIEVLGFEPLPGRIKKYNIKLRYVLYTSNSSESTLSQPSSQAPIITETTEKISISSLAKSLPYTIYASPVMYEYPYSFDDVWDAANKALLKQKETIITSDRNKGTIVGQGEGASRHWSAVLIEKKAEDSTLVTVKSMAYREDQAVASSTNLYSDMVQQQIQKELKSKVRQPPYFVVIEGKQYKVSGDIFTGKKEGRVFKDENERGAVVRDPALAKKIAQAAWVYENIVRPSGPPRSQQVSAILNSYKDLRRYELTQDILARVSVQILVATISGGTTLTYTVPAGLTWRVVHDQFVNLKGLLSLTGRQGLEEALSKYQQMESLMAKLKPNYIDKATATEIKKLYDAAYRLDLPYSALLTSLMPKKESQLVDNALKSIGDELVRTLPLSDEVLTTSEVISLQGKMDDALKTDPAFKEYYEKLNLVKRLTEANGQTIAAWAEQAVGYKE